MKAKLVRLVFATIAASALSAQAAPSLPPIHWKKAVPAATCQASGSCCDGGACCNGGACCTTPSH